MQNGCQHSLPQMAKHMFKHIVILSAICQQRVAPHLTRPLASRIRLGHHTLPQDSLAGFIKAQKDGQLHIKSDMCDNLYFLSIAHTAL
jgi:hypothetical protein